MNARYFFAVFALLVLSLTELHAAGTSVFTALKAIPKPAAKNLARIEAYEGAPLPERWYVLTYDPTLPYGLREFAVENGKVVANRTLSQFADLLQPNDVIGAQALKTDTKALVTSAEAFLAANKKSPGTFDFKLMRDPGTPDPVWKVNCIDGEGDQIGTLIMSATDGRVISHPGFENAPDLTAARPTPAPVPPTSRPVAVRETRAREIPVRVGPEVSDPPRPAQPSERVAATPAEQPPPMDDDDDDDDDERDPEDRPDADESDPAENEGGLRKPKKREEKSRSRNTRSREPSREEPSVFRRLGGRVKNLFD